jgi:aminoglycoside phosphotransferase (APT) family kinase protein
MKRFTGRMTGDDGGRIAEMTRAGLGAAVRVAREQGLPGNDPEVLSSRGNVLVRLRPAPVVARVATLTAWTRSDPFRWLAREVAVAGYAADHGGPVVAPTALADPGPHWSDGLAVSLWSFVPPSPARPEPAEVGEALARLHIAAAAFPGDLPVLSPLRELIRDGLAALEREGAADRALLAALRDRHAEVLAELDDVTGPTLVLHGDAHAGNLLQAAGAGPGWLWVDLEETCRGPRAFDLAVLIERAGADAGTALAAYAVVTGEPPPVPEVLALFTRARRLEGAVWTLGMAYQYPARYRGPARALLADVLGQDAADRLS